MPVADCSEHRRIDFTQKPARQIKHMDRVDERNAAHVLIEPPASDFVRFTRRRICNSLTRPNSPDCMISRIRRNIGWNRNRNAGMKTASDTPSRSREYPPLACVHRYGLLTQDRNATAEKCLADVGLLRRRQRDAHGIEIAMLRSRDNAERPRAVSLQHRRKPDQWSTIWLTSRQEHGMPPNAVARPIRMPQSQRLS